MNSRLEDYRQQFQRIAAEATALAGGLAEDRFWRRPADGGWSVGECFAHLTAVGSEEVQAIEKATAEARAKGIAGTGPFRCPAWERLIVWMTEPPVKQKAPAPKRFVPLPGQPAKVVMDGFLALQRQFVAQVERADGLDLRRVKVPTPIGQWLKLSLGGLLAQAAAHERRHLAQAKKVLAQIPK
jgi:hypothetical protein